MDNKEILDLFGKKIITNVFDDNLKYFKQVLSGTTKWGTDSEFTEAIQSLNEKEKKIILGFFKKQLETCLFSFLSIFEEDNQFKINFEDGGLQINLNEISEMLKAEPLSENGWIARFSEEIKEDEII